MPGWLFSRRLGFPCAGSVAWITHPARALTFSVAIVALIELVCSSLGFGMVALIGSLAALSGVLVFLEKGDDPDAAQAPPHSSADRTALVIFASVAVTAIFLSSAGENIARDRMWYSAWINSLAAAEALDWAEPFFGTGFIPARFVHNAWLATLGAVTALSHAPPPELLADFLPPLLTLCAASAAWMLADAVFGSGYKASLGAVAGLIVLLTTHYPFFSPERYAFFGRLPEDKFVALLIFMPVALAMLWRLVDKTSIRATAMSLAACTAVSFSHAIVQLLLVLSFVPYVLWRSVIARRATLSSAVVAIAILATTSLAPGLSALRARAQIVETPAPVTVLENDMRHPVVRSHLRMERLSDLSIGGPIVTPSLIGEPVLLIALLGLIAAFGRRNESWGAFLLAASLAHLALAFVPFLAPTFGRIVVPWMAYRALWGVPFGLLLGALLIETVRTITPVEGGRAGPIAVTTIILLGAVSPLMPWDRLETPTTSRAGIDTETVALLDEISKLPPSARIAAANGLAELIPAFTGRHILSFSDRGTIVFTGRRRHAERRLIANAVLLGLYGGSGRIRNRVVSDFDVTHTVYEQRPCDRRAAELYRTERFTLCAERFHTARRFRMSRTTAVAGQRSRGVAHAMLGDLLACTPEPTYVERTHTWRWVRDRRWSGRPVVIDCEATFPLPTQVGMMRIALNLPKASEALVYHAAVEMSDGKVLRRQGIIEFRENPNAELILPRGMIRKVRVRLVPAYLPYLNASALDLRS